MLPSEHAHANFLSQGASSNSNNNAGMLHQFS
eukprot:CAMPEP_0119566162 /NCGR_PEP_ID=MMETSP1352-20130426/32308_1 /TAXON_ID=265584 /ORGANISM="Stauroneis constricta, Strain CCMP1120" /LENGTH=31 /DNA_ID= /DNA_START= /DNA_END= /DNA_ORIENTATION=